MGHHNAVNGNYFKDLSSIFDALLLTYFSWLTKTFWQDDNAVLKNVNVIAILAFSSLWWALFLRHFPLKQRQRIFPFFTKLFAHHFIVVFHYKYYYNHCMCTTSDLGFEKSHYSYLTNYYSGPMV